MMTSERWRSLLRLLQPDRPPDNMNVYVSPAKSSAESICQGFTADPTARHKCLLVGARGGGKSTELREVFRRLDGHATRVTIDLDASGISAAAVSAFDLLYISGLALLKLVTDNERNALFGSLSKAYAGNDHNALGEVNEAVAGLVSFAQATEGFAAAIDVLATGGAVSTSINVVRQGLRLFGNSKEVVAESSPRGRTLQAVCRDIARLVHDTPGAKPICLLIDGLEKMNGEANERFRQVFCDTRLLADADWSMVIAAPPSTLTATNSATAVGYRIVPVWGFGPDDTDGLATVIKKRFQAADMDREVDEAQLRQLAEASGGLPRYAIQMTRHAVEQALLANAQRIKQAHVDQGIRQVGESLALGLTIEDFEILRRVDKGHLLPGGERAARLFADGRILAHAPAGNHRRPRFMVHPVLVPDVIDSVSVDEDSRDDQT